MAQFIQMRDPPGVDPRNEVRGRNFVRQGVWGRIKAPNGSRAGPGRDEASEIRSC